MSGIVAGKGRCQAFDLKRYLAQQTAAVDRALDRFLPPASAKPATIHRAMRYSIFAGGKRLRPALAWRRRKRAAASRTTPCRWLAPWNASTPIP